MNNRDHIKEELSSLGSQLPLLDGRIYALPDNYFEQFADSVLARIRSSAFTAEQELKELSPLLAGISKKMPYSVPDGYFETLEAGREEEKIPAVFEFISKEGPYTVPAGYFDEFPRQMLHKLERPKGKVVQMFRKPSFVRMAVAAAFTGIMAIGGFFYLDQPSSNGGQSIARKLNNVSDQALDDFLNNTDAAHKEEVAQTASYAAEVRNMMEDISATEIDAFLAQIPTDDEDLQYIN